VEIAALVLGIVLERLRPDLWVRGRWAALRLPRPGGRLAVPLPVALAGVDARRLLLRPSTLLALYVLYRIFSPPLPLGSAYDGVNRFVGLSVAVLGVIVLAVTASIGGRDRGVEIVEAAPADPRRRLLSWLVLLGGLAAFEYVALVALRFGKQEAWYHDLMPNAWELTQGPIMLLGAGLLGVLLARLVPGWVAAPIGVVLTVVWVGVLSDTLPGATMLAPVVEWVQFREDGRVVVEPGRFGWHNAYLLGVCGLGVVALMLTAPGRRRGLLLTGIALTAGTVVAGVLALP
jgi:hypothetical protein